MKNLLRILSRNKTFSILNILGLAIGITCAALILLWVEDEMTYNDFPKQKQLYKVFDNQVYSGEIVTFSTLPNPLAAVLKEDIVGIKNVTRFSYIDKRLFTLDDKMIYEAGTSADSSIFSMLDIEFVSGNATIAFDAPYPIVITQAMAAKFFGTDDPIGKSLKIDNEQEYQVTAVIKNMKSNSDFDFSWLMPFKNNIKRLIDMGYVNENVETQWGCYFMQIYVELETGADVNHVNEQIRDLMIQNSSDPNCKTTLFLYPVSKTKLYREFKDGVPTGSGFVRYVRLFFWIAVLILVIACINFMNLSTARSQKRTLEVGMRKTFGAGRFQLIRQFLFESGAITAASLLLALIFIELALPQFNNLVGKELAMNFANPVHWIGLLSIGLICSVVAGAYPAFFLSSFPPIEILRKLKIKSGMSMIRLREILIVFQFSASLVLIIFTAFIYLQVKHTKDRDLGMNVNNVLLVNGNQDIENHFAALEHELIATGVVESVGSSLSDMMNMWNNSWGWQWQGKPDEINPLITNVFLSDGLFDLLEITISEGRRFEEALDKNTNRIVINRALADIMGEEGQIDGKLWQGTADDGQPYTLTIIGIIDNFVFNDITSTKVSPAIFRVANDASEIFIRLKPGDFKSSIQKIEKAYKQIDTQHPFEYTLMEDQLNKMLGSTLLVGKLSGLFAILAIFISCLGLFGLAAFAAEQRTREIGIRKVFGATIRNIVELVGGNFILLIAISFVIAIPLAWWIAHQWLQSYEYRIALSWWVFAASGLLVIVIALLTVSFQALRAALTNPVEAMNH